MLRVERLEKITDISTDDWNDLLSRSITNTVHLTHQWAKCWCDTVGKDIELVLLAAYDRDDLIGIAPLVINYQIRGPLKTKTLEFIGFIESDYCDFIIDSSRTNEAHKVFFDYILNDLRNWQKISLTSIRESSPTVEFIRKLASERSLKIKESVSAICPALDFDSGSEFINKALNRRIMRRRYNYFNNTGLMEYHKPENSDDIIRELETFFDFHKDRWLLLGEKSNFLQKSTREFYRELVRVMNPAGLLRFEILKFNSTPVAYHLGFIYNNVYINYTQTFDLDYFKKSPGNVLLKLRMEECIEMGLREFDFTRGLEGYKIEFSNMQRKNIRFEIFRTGFRYAFSIQAHRIKDHIKKRNPALFKLIKRSFDPSTYSESLHEFRRLARKRKSIPFVVSFVFQKITRLIYWKLNMLVFSMSLKDRDINWTPGNFSIREGKFSDLKYFVREHTFTDQAKLLQVYFDRLSKNHRVFVAEKNNQLAHFSWVSTIDKIHIIEMDYEHKLPCEMWYVYHAFTEPEFRNQGIYQDVLRYLADAAADAGSDYLCGYVVAKNLTPQRQILKTGAQLYFGVSMTKFLGTKKFRTVQYNHLNGA